MGERILDPCMIISVTVSLSESEREREREREKLLGSEKADSLFCDLFFGCTD